MSTCAIATTSSPAWSRASPASATLTYRGQAERVDVELVSGNTFDVLGVDADRRPRAHRRTTTARLARIRWRCSATATGSAASPAIPAVLNQVVTINSTPMTIVGVAPTGFAGVVSDADARPLRADDDEGADHADVERPRQSPQPLGQHRRPAEARADAGRGQGAARRASIGRSTSTSSWRCRRSPQASPDVQGAVPRQEADAAPRRARPLGPARRACRRRSSC